MRTHRPVTLLPLVLVVLFAPLNYSDLPDQTWLRGLWDGGDNDDIILQFESTGATVESLSLPSIDPVLVVVGYTPMLHETAVIPTVVSTIQDRAPPAL